MSEDAVKLESPPCALCGGKSFRIVHSGLSDLLLGRRGEWTVAECERCGMVQTRPRPDPDSISRFYPPEYGRALSAALPRGHGTLAALAAVRDAPFHLRYGRQRAHSPAHGRDSLLEIGCAAGVNLVSYVDAGWDARAIEPGAELAAVAAERAGIPPDHVQNSSAEDAVFADASFDLIVMYHVIEHLHDPLAVLRSARKWIREGGTLEIGCPNYGSLERRIFGSYWIGLDVPRHLSQFTPSTLTRMLKEAGFKVTAIVPEREYLTTSLSASAALDGLLGRRRAVPGSRAMQLVTLPYAVASRVLGAKPCMLVSAIPA